MAKANAIVSVRDTRIDGKPCFGIGDGKKWFFYAYPTQAQAEKVFERAGKFLDQVVREWNISQEQAYKLVTDLDTR
jgi:hypothetical protein